MILFCHETRAYLKVPEMNFQTRSRLGLVIYSERKTMPFLVPVEATEYANAGHGA